MEIVLSERYTMKRVVTMGGGTGQYTLLSGLKTIPDIDITAIVTMADSGGSSGVLRTERGALPPGDVLQCLLALATVDDDIVDLFQHRFSSGGAMGAHTLGNIALTAAAEKNGSFLKGIKTAEKMLRPRGHVLPVTTDRVELCARLSDGASIRGEHRIDRREHAEDVRISDLWLEPSATANPDVLEAIAGADAIVAGPGDLFTSILPNVLVADVADALARAPGTLIFVVNTMTKQGETDEFGIADFVETFERHAQRRVDIIVYNTQTPAPDLLAKYEIEGSTLVSAKVNGHASDRSRDWEGRTIIPFPLLSAGSFARHDPIKLAHVIRALC
jgi:uncharacterized cofD-like protein